MTFDEMIQQNKPVLVNFYATWCAPCKMMSPILQDVKKRVGDNAGIFKIDVDKNPQAAAAYGVRGIPTLFLLKNGSTVWRKLGVVAAKELENIMNTNA